MKRKYFILMIILSFIVEIVVICLLVNKSYVLKNDTVKLNELVYEIENNFNDEKKYPNTFSYSIIDSNENLIYKNSNNISTSLNDAYMNRDTIIDLNIEGVSYKLLISNDLKEIISKNNNTIITSVIIISLIQLICLAIYYIYLERNILSPFKDMKEYATRISNGDLDIPLKMDRGNNFGAFTESFDIMRVELKKARLKEKEANDSKRELVAKLSHDIKTPVASIKSSSELGSEITKDEKDKYYFDCINMKADQINTLVSNLLMSSLEDLEKISINPSQSDSYILYDLIEAADYLKRVGKYIIPECKIFIDRVRLQQVIDNIISNSYKYANTKIDCNSYIENEYLILSFRDYGEGVDLLELPLLTEKYKRGANSKGLDGVGLGLYISKSFVSEMNGILELGIDNPGFIVTIKLRII